MLTVKVYQTMCVKNREMIPANRFLTGISDRVISQQLLADEVTNSLQLVNLTLAMAAAVSASEHLR